MGVYIEGMEMPKNDCTAYREVIISNNYIGNGKMKILVCDAQTNTFIGEATEVPEPHGRLIDADALADDLEADGKEFGDEMKLNCASWLRSNATPTVIERSE